MYFNLKTAIIALLLVSTVLLTDRGAFSYIEVEDFRGKSIKLQKPAQRIVCLIESALSGLYMLGVEQKVVGISIDVYTTDVFNYYSKIDQRIKSKKIEAPGNWEKVNIELIIKLKPDLVIIWSEQKDVIFNLEKAGIPVYGVFIKSIKDVFKEIEDFGKLTGYEERAKELIRQVKKEVISLQDKLSKIKKKPKVYFMWAQSILDTSCKDSIVEELINIAKAKNVCSHINLEHAVINMEQLILWNPEVIIMWYNQRMDPIDIIKNKQLRHISAIRNSRVYELPDVFTCDLWTLKFIYPLKLFSKWLHPDLMEDFDIEKEKLKMLNMLYFNKFN